MKSVARPRRGAAVEAIRNARTISRSMTPPPSRFDDRGELIQKVGIDRLHGVDEVCDRRSRIGTQDAIERLLQGRSLDRRALRLGAVDEGVAGSFSGNKPLGEEAIEDFRDGRVDELVGLSDHSVDLATRGIAQRPNRRENGVLKIPTRKRGWGPHVEKLRQPS